MNLLEQLFSHICGQQHCWVLGGVRLPLCQRCIGLYAGAFLALIIVRIFRPRPRAFLYWAHGFFLLAMIPFGFHLVAHGGLTRTFTGALFAFGLVYYLTLNPLTAWRAWSDDSPARTAGYLLAAALAIGLVLLMASWDNRVSAFVLVSLGTVGFLGLCCFALLNLAILPSSVREIRRKSFEYFQ
ncbi:MAG TPA: DUF2085 domain-containing protein [Dongiaceae bacterium]|nr:DUF2085 domain-containing protein [Dongiaceae bacterium]